MLLRGIHTAISSFALFLYRDYRPTDLVGALHRLHLITVQNLAGKRNSNQARSIRGCHTYTKDFVSGIAEKFSYFSDIGINIVSVNSLYESSDVTKDYEITDFRNIDPVYGTMEDMENLIVNAHDEGNRLLWDCR